MKNKKIFFLIMFLSFVSVLGQEIHVKYLHVRSNIATLDEDLYIKDNKTISIQDSIIYFNRNMGSGVVVRDKSSKKGNLMFYFISNVSKEKNKNFFFTTNLKGEKFFIHDEVNQPQWEIDKNEMKKILGYPCYKATGNFRGSDMIAYYTPEIPVSSGPFKFFGLPGLILEVKVKNKSYHRWKAKKIEMKVPEKINFQPEFPNYTAMTMRGFIEHRDGVSKSDANQMNVKLMKVMPTGTKIISKGRRNFALEKHFEWEE